MILGDGFCFYVQVSKLFVHTSVHARCYAKRFSHPKPLISVVAFVTERCPYVLITPAVCFLASFCHCDADVNIKLNPWGFMWQAKEQVQQYFAGQRKTFSVPVELQGTLFQRKAWAALNMIPYGETWTYTEQAEGMGEHGKARAVGMANGKNPVCLLVPCHRVVGKGGNLRGYAFGVEIKQSLLEFEASHLSKGSDN